MTNEEEKQIAYFVSAVPWKGCPFKLQLVIWTTKDNEDAIRVFKGFYENENLEIAECFEITVLRSDLFDEARKKRKEQDN